MPDSTKISPGDALILHQQFTRNTPNPIRTQAVIISIREVIEIINKMVPHGKRTFINFDEFPSDTIICYFARNASNHATYPNRDTMIIQFAKKNADNSFSAIENEIYDFGDIKPPKLISGEQITP